MEVVDAVLARIERLNPALNCYATVTAEEARDAAVAAEVAVETGEELGPLHGVPVSIKDLVFTRRVLTTGGSRLFADHVPEEDAVCVERLKGAGAIIVGKTTTPEFGHKAVTDSPLFGITRNPWNLGAHAGRLERRRGRGGGRRPGAARGGHRRGRLHPHPRLLLRDLRAQAVLRARAAVPRLPGLGDALPQRAAHAHRARRGADARRDRGPRRSRPALAARGRPVVSSRRARAASPG